MRDNFGVAWDPGWLNRELTKLRREIESLRSERRAASTTIGKGGSLVVDGGDVLMLDTDGSVLFRLGTQTHSDRGVSISRDDASLALAIRKEFPNTPQTVEISDADGNRIFAEESLGSGIRRPYLTIPMQPVQATAAPMQAGPYGWQIPLTATTFTSTHQAWYTRLNQFGYFRAQIAASDTTTAAEVRVINVSSGDVLSPFLGSPWVGTRATGSTGYVEVASPPLFLPGIPDEQITIAVQVRRSAGAGTLQAALPESRGS